VMKTGRPHTLETLERIDGTRQSTLVVFRRALENQS
jgi:hypothetical protein